MTECSRSVCRQQAVTGWSIEPRWHQHSCIIKFILLLLLLTPVWWWNSNTWSMKRSSLCVHYLCGRFVKLFVSSDDWFFFSLFPPFPESSDEDEASGDEGLPDEDSDVSLKSSEHEGSGDLMRHSKQIAAAGFAGVRQRCLFLREAELLCCCVLSTGRRTRRWRRRWRTTTRRSEKTRAAEQNPKQTARRTWSTETRAKKNENTHTSEA